MKVTVRADKVKLKIPVPLGMARFVIHCLPNSVFEKMGKDVPPPYDGLVSKEWICLLTDECLNSLSEYKGLEIVHVEANDGTFVSIIL